MGLFLIKIKSKTNWLKHNKNIDFYCLKNYLIIPETSIHNIIIETEKIAPAIAPPLAFKLKTECSKRDGKFSGST